MNTTNSQINLQIIDIINKCVPQNKGKQKLRNYYLLIDAYKEGFRHFVYKRNIIFHLQSLTYNLFHCHNGTLIDFRTNFIQHRLACKKLLELKQKSLPRLAFLSDKEALILLGGLSGVRSVFQQVACKIFGLGVTRIHFETVAAGSESGSTSDQSTAK